MKKSLDYASEILRAVWIRILLERMFSRGESVSCDEAREPTSLLVPLSDRPGELPYVIEMSRRGHRGSSSGHFPPFGRQPWKSPLCANNTKVSAEHLVSSPFLGQFKAEVSKSHRSSRHLFLEVSA